MTLRNNDDLVIKSCMPHTKITRVVSWPITKAMQLIVGAATERDGEDLLMAAREPATYSLTWVTSTT